MEILRFFAADDDQKQLYIAQTYTQRVIIVLMKLILVAFILVTMLFEIPQAEAAEQKIFYVRSSAVLTALENGKRSYGSYKGITKCTSYSDQSLLSVEWWSLTEAGAIAGSGNFTFNKVNDKWLLNMNFKAGNITATGTGDLIFKDNELSKATGVAKSPDKNSFEIEITRIPPSYHFKMTVTNLAGEEIRKDDLQGFTITEEEFNKILNHK